MNATPLPIPLSGNFAIRALMSPKVRSEFPFLDKLFKEMSTAGKTNCTICGGTKKGQGQQATAARDFIANMEIDKLTILKKAMNIADGQKLILFQRAGARYERKEL